VPMGYFSPFLTNHDQPRLGYQLGGDLAKAKLAAAMLLSSPGTTYLYYGEEIGLTQAADASHMQRRAPMLWDQSLQAGFTSAQHAWVERTDLFPPQPDATWWMPFLAKQLDNHRTVADLQQDQQSIWHLYQQLIALKHQRPEFGVNGEYRASTEANGHLLRIERQLDNQQTVLLLNLSNQSQAIATGLQQDAAYSPYWSEPDAATDELGPWQLRIWTRN